MRNYLACLFILIAFVACKDEKTAKVNSGAGAGNELSTKYEKLKLPFHVADTTMLGLAGTSPIDYTTFTKNIPDSIFNTPFNQNRKIELYPIGKIEQAGKETYFATLAKSKNLAAIYLSVFDSGKHTATLPLIVSDDNPAVVYTASIDKKLSVAVNKESNIKDALYYTRNIYAYNNVGIFTTVLTETNEDNLAGGAISNPLDTFPKTMKYSGDYAKGNKNVMFIRDSGTPNEYLFFVHFENEDEEDNCGGEIRGRFKMTSDKAGVYSANGDPCVLDITFSGNQVQVKETGTCGNYRGIKCFFNNTFTKKKEAKSSVKKK